MKLKLLLLLTLSYSIFSTAQSKEELAVKDFFWGENDSYKNITDIPEKWKNESAVVLYKNENYDFHKYGKNVTYISSVRKRIKLLDKAAVEEFSEFTYKKRFRVSKGYYFWGQKDGKRYVGIKIIKPDGSTTEVDVDNDAVEVDGETKIAIANLEVGDIIDYYSYISEEFKSAIQYGFDAVETVLGEDYPIVDFKLFFETENDFFINFNSYNGAPDLKEIPTEKKNMRRYELVASDLEKNEFPRWVYPLVEFPAYKFQVYFARSGRFENNAMAFLPKEETTVKSSVNKEEVLKFYESWFEPSGDIGHVYDYLKGKTYTNDAEKTTAVYYFMRHYFLTRFIEAYYLKEAKILNDPFDVYEYNATTITYQPGFINSFMIYLEKSKIDFEIVIAKNRYDGPIEDLLLQQNLDLSLKINTSPTLYLSMFGPHTDVNYIDPQHEGTEVLLLSATKKKIDIIKEGVLPASSYKDNETKKIMTLTLDDNFEGFSIASKNSYKGHEKSEQQPDRLLLNDYLKEDYALTDDTQPYIELIKNKKLNLKVEGELNSLIEKLKEKQMERFENNAKGEFDVKEVEDYTYNIDATGRYGLETYFTFSESFKAKSDNLVKKAGPNYIVEIGKLIGGQIDVTDKERGRTENIYMDYPRSYNYTIRFNVPKGYSVSGLDKLNKSVDNSTGAFISSAQMEGDVLVVKTSKQYKHNFEPNSNWPLMIAFLDEANQFTNEKILLKKE
ncbi:MAG: hypothetical protein ACSHXF_12135 [Aquaticitalea sp.]